jgi:Na+-translocating ferredoxin:NAD+ oxidoreductase RnfD subunit
MLLTLLGIVKVVTIFPAGYATKVSLSLLYKTPLSEAYLLLPELTYIATRLLQPLKAPFPMLITLLGMVMLVRLVQPEKAPCPMLITLSGMVMLARLVQPEKAPYPMLVTLSGTVLQFSYASS